MYKTALNPAFSVAPPANLAAMAALRYGGLQARTRAGGCRCGVRQDKSSSVGVHTVRRMMSDDDDVLLVNVGSGLTAAHIASLSHNSGTNIYAYGITSDRHQKNVNKLLDKLGVRGIYTSLSST